LTSWGFQGNDTSGIEDHDGTAGVATRAGSKVRVGSKGRVSWIPKVNLADCANKWSLPLETVKESSELFSQFAQVPRSQSGEDVLKAGVLNQDNFMKVVCHLCCVSSCYELTLTDQRVMNGDILFASKVMGTADKNSDGEIDFEEFTIWYNDRAFLEFVTLSKEQRMVRSIAHRLGVTAADMDHYKAVYDRFDLDKNGSIDKDEFRELLHVLMRCPPSERFPESRIMHFWNECDDDGDGQVDLEEFVNFYVNHFKHHAEDPLKDFYHSFRNHADILQADV